MYSVFMDSETRAHFGELNSKIDRVIDVKVVREDLRQFEERLELEIDKRIGELTTAGESKA